MKICSSCMLAAMAILALAMGARADQIIVYNTGVNSSGEVLPDGTVGDPHYTLVTVPGGTTDLLVRTSVGGFPVAPAGPYFGDDSLSAWIGPDSDNELDGPVGIYDYQTTFSLSGLNPSTASLSIGWSSDNAGADVLLNGQSLGQTSSPIQYSGGFVFFTVNSGFLPNLNTLDFLVDNGGATGNPTALRVEISGTATPTTPEPVSFSLLGCGLLCLGVLRRRRLQ